MALVIDESILQQAQALVDRHDVIGAWGVLAAAGDSYAAKAELIVGEDTKRRLLVRYRLQSH